MQPTHDQLRKWDREVVWHGFTQMAEYEPLIIERGQGCKLIDIGGREFIDGVSSLWCNVHGHRHPRLDAAMRGQLENIAHNTSLGMSNPTTIELAKRLVDLAPDGLAHVFFASDGSNAVEAAIKIAFQYWQQCDEPRPKKTKFVAFGEAYHGDTIGSVSVGGVERFHSLFRPMLFDVLRLPMPDTYRLPAGVTRDTSADYYLGQVEAVLAANHESIAALVVEPLVQGAAGMIVHPDGLLRGVRELTSKYDVLLIADEVAVGFGRTGTLFACEQEGVSPDLLCVGKGITGGYLPMSAALATSKVFNAFLGRYDEFKAFFHGHTYGGNPLAAAVANASLDVFEEEQTLQRMSMTSGRLRDHLQRIAAHPSVGDVRQRGLMAGIEFVQDKDRKTPFPLADRRGQQVCQHALDEGVWLRPLGDVVIIMPPLSITVDELDAIMAAVEMGIDAVAAAT